MNHKNDVLGRKGLDGWVIVHQNGWNELDYWDMPVGQWWPDGKSRRKQRRKDWIATYRPGCRLVRATLRPNGQAQARAGSTSPGAEG